MIFPRKENPDLDYISPALEVNIGLWVLWTTATVLLGLRIWCKTHRLGRYGLWYDDYVLLVAWVGFPNSCRVVGR